MSFYIENNHGEKVSVNMNSGTLSCIDLLVDNGYYSNRSDFINQAVRDLVRSHQSTIDRIVDSNMQKASAPKATNLSATFGISASRTKDPEEGERLIQDSWFFGISGLTFSELEKLKLEGKQINISGYGVLTISNDCPEELVFEVVNSIKVRGKVICSDAIREHYGLKK